MEKFRSRSHLAQTISSAGFDLPEALNSCRCDNRSARPLHPDPVTDCNLAPRDRMTGLMSLSENADLWSIASTAYEIRTPDNNVIHDRLLGAHHQHPKTFAMHNSTGIRA
jgi:hypothetical protein